MSKRLPRKYKLILFSSLLAGSAFLAVAAARQETSDAHAAPVTEVKLVKAISVSAQSIADDRRAVGEIRPRRESDLGFRVSGKLVMRHVEVGKTVRKGDLLARIEDQDYRNRLISAKADQAAAEAVYYEAKAAEQRIGALLGQGYTTRANHDATLKNLRSAEAKLEAAKASVAMAEDQLRYTRLHADFDGIVTAVSADAGQIVNTGQMIVRLAAPDAKDAVFSIAEAAFGKPFEVNELPRITVSLLSNPGISTSGTVREIAPVADATTRTYEVKVSLDDAPDEMRFGASIAGRLEIASAPVVVLPGSALFDKAGKPAVWVVDPASQVELKPIVVARYEADRVVVREGLADGDVVVTAGVNRLRENQKVRIEEGAAK
jgi:RND family efflux transporter MFP subunit